MVSLAELMESHRIAVQAFFFGLVAGALGVLLGEAGRGRAPRWTDFAAATGGVAAGWGIAVAVPASTPESAWFVFAAGALAAAAMILPGVSGAYVLVLLKKYVYVLAALGRLDLAVLVPFGLGVAAGLMLLSRALGWLLGRHRRPTLFALAGLVAGSLWSLWPYRIATGGGSAPTWPDAFEATTLLPAAGGVALVAALHLRFTACGRRPYLNQARFLPRPARCRQTGPCARPGRSPSPAVRTHVLPGSERGSRLGYLLPHAFKGAGRWPMS